MLKNYIKITWRNLLKNKLFSTINIFGLSVGLATCLLLLLYIFDELSYDSHHADVDRVYRIATQVEDKQWAATPAPLAEATKSELPEVSEITRVLKFPNTDHMLLENAENNTRFYETKGFYADSTFFTIFSYESKYGDITNALKDPNTVVLSERVALKLFGDKNPINKTINIEIPYGKMDYTVKGVFKENGKKSHVAPNLVLSMQNGDLGQWVATQDNWANNNLFHTYFRLSKGSDLSSFEKKLVAFWKEKSDPDFVDTAIEKTLILQPIKDIYLKSEMGNEISANGSMKYIYIFGSIAVFLLLIACVNFMNLSTARSEKRAREVGVRKVMGANKSSLVAQFLGESILLSILSLLLAVGIVLLTIPLFNEFTGKSVSFLQYEEILYWISGLVLFTGLVSGLYPAFYLSSFKAANVLKGKLSNSIGAMVMRKGLVVFQFAVSVVLILVAVVIWNQMEYLDNKDLGFKKEQQLVIPFRSGATVENYDALKGEVIKIKNIKMATAGTTYPGFELVTDMTFYAEGKTSDDHVYMKFASVYEDYLETMEYELLYGRPFSKSRETEMDAIIINETAVKNFGYDLDQAVGRTISYSFDGQSEALKIIGVIKDFNHQSLHEAISPYGIVKLENGQPNYFIANVTGDDLQSTLSEVEKAWASINPSTPFEYSFMDDDFNQNYAKEKSTSWVITSFTLIAIFIACIGLFGLSSFTTEQRKKEVGIRRVLGATVLGITALHLKDFLKLVLVALLLASPISYYLGNRWLEDFVYRIDIGWQLFAIASLLVVLIAVFTIGFQVIKAALANPANSLRTE